MSQTMQSGRAFRAEVRGETIDLMLNGTTVVVNGQSHEVSFEFISENDMTLLVDGRSVPAVIEPEGEGRYLVTIRGRVFPVCLKDERDMILERFSFAGGASGSLQQVRAPMPGLVLSVLVEKDQPVDPGTGLLVLEAMKMENELRAEAPAIVKGLHVAAGDAVGKNDLLMELEPRANGDSSPG